jgi:hypothetical protein
MFNCVNAGCVNCLQVPRLCPAGRVCDVTGLEALLQLCPEGHFCLEGTATTATTCGHPTPSSRSAAVTYCAVTGYIMLCCAVLLW